jgi:putative FmdB family regulatory protein
MPTYGYRCEKNGHEFEVVQSFSDPPLKRCRICGSRVNRIFYPVGIVFKGSGFYATDNRAASKVSSAGDKPESDGKGDGAEAKPAKSDTKPRAKDKDKGDSKPKTGTTTNP